MHTYFKPRVYTFIITANTKSLILYPLSHTRGRYAIVVNNNASGSVFYATLKTEPLHEAGKLNRPCPLALALLQPQCVMLESMLIWQCLTYQVQSVEKLVLYQTTMQMLKMETVKNVSLVCSLMISDPCTKPSHT